MSRNLGYFHVWENCFHTIYGKKAALFYAEPTYCHKGLRFFTDTDKQDVRHPECPDWHKCQCRLKAMNMK